MRVSTQSQEDRGFRKNPEIFPGARQSAQIEMGIGIGLASEARDLQHRPVHQSLQLQPALSPDAKAVPNGGEPQKLQSQNYSEVSWEEGAGLGRRH